MIQVLRIWLNQKDIYAVENIFLMLKVTSDEMVENITVTTWDIWSLMPTISFGRQDRESTHSIGLKERNLLGLVLN